jgi:cytidyltransferase-like protein
MVVYTVGTFDLLHVGHLALLEYCATLGETQKVLAFLFAKHSKQKDLKYSYKK